MMEAATVAEATRHLEPVVHVTNTADEVPLRAMDHARHGSGSAATMLAWPEELGDVHAVADGISTHQDTVRYRRRHALATRDDAG